MMYILNFDNSTFYPIISPGGLLKYDLGRDVPLRLEK